MIRSEVYEPNNMSEPSELENDSNAEKVREFYRRQGAMREKNRIVKLLTNQPFIWMGEKQLLQTSKDQLIALIKGETNELQ